MFFLDANDVCTILVLVIFLVMTFFLAVCSQFWGVGLMSNYEEGVVNPPLLM